MFRQRIEIIASPSYVWDVMVDFANWPQWTPTVSQLTVLTHGEPGVGTSVSIKQPTLPASTWTVTEWRNRSFFTWVSKAFGLTTRAHHDIRATPQGCALVLTIEFDGFWAPFASLLAGNLTERYLQQECEGLRNFCEKPLSRDPVS